MKIILGIVLILVITALWTRAVENKRRNKIKKFEELKK